MSAITRHASEDHLRKAVDALVASENNYVGAVRNEITVDDGGLSSSSIRVEPLGGSFPLGCETDDHTGHASVAFCAVRPRERRVGKADLRLGRTDVRPEEAHMVALGYRVGRDEPKFGVMSHNEARALDQPRRHVVHIAVDLL